ncbi:hypothetical protein [Fretibacterium fastidiosum]|uniref:Uncharacterized protein n=1 Tax=Fretibacterium fastidiosum TaxID=651822 RepID=A0AB94IWX9_9BACT|nr:hypothetical protein [Fretibacterium fastidiosum]CBL28273.1 hypothetical protein SY1_10690 [Fretibacterium fastidiosum]
MGLRQPPEGGQPPGPRRGLSGAILDRSRSMADRLIEGKLPDGTEGWDGLASEDLLPGAWTS